MPFICVSLSCVIILVPTFKIHKRVFSYLLAPKPKIEDVRQDENSCCRKIQVLKIWPNYKLGSDKFDWTIDVRNASMCNAAVNAFWSSARIDAKKRKEIQDETETSLALQEMGYETPKFLFQI